MGKRLLTRPRSEDVVKETLLSALSPNINVLRNETYLLLNSCYECNDAITGTWAKDFCYLYSCKCDVGFHCLEDSRIDIVRGFSSLQG